MILKNEDCLDYLSDIETESVDMIVVDPPYFQIVKNDWDNQWKTEDDYLAWCAKWTREASRVLKKGGCLFVWGTTKTDTFLKYKLNVLNSIDELQYQNWIIWAYDWGGRTKKKFPRKHEDLLMYSKGKEFLFNADDVRVERAVKVNMNLQRKINLLKRVQGCGDMSIADAKILKTMKLTDATEEEVSDALEVLLKKNSVFTKGKIPTDVWFKNNHTTSKEYAGWHPTQKPIELMERIIKAHTNDGGVVCDFFSGSGSTAVAAINCGRVFTGCELDEEYYRNSLSRIERLTKDEVS